MGGKQTVLIDGERIDVVEIDRPFWGAIVSRAVDGDDVFVSFIVSLGPNMIDTPVDRRLTSDQRSRYEAGTLDLPALAERIQRELNA